MYGEVLHTKKKKKHEKGNGNKLTIQIGTLKMLLPQQLLQPNILTKMYLSKTTVWQNKQKYHQKT